MSTIYLLITVKWIRENMLELVETVTTEGGASSDEAIREFRIHRRKYMIVLLYMSYIYPFSYMPYIFAF